MFWGLHLEGGKRYSQTALKSFRITHATLERKDANPIPNCWVSVRAAVEEDYILCYLGKLTSTHVISQVPLDIKIAAGEKVVLYTKLEGDPHDCTNEEYVVHLVGYFEIDDIADKSSSIPTSSSYTNGLPMLKAGSKRPNNATSPQPKKKKVEAKLLQPTTKKKKLTSFKTKGGTEVEEVEEGSGKVAKPGRKVFVKYTGRLASTNCIFDSNIDQQRAFMFRLGQGEVVKGWDEGLQGMKVGGKRKLTIPPSQGYGAKGAPPKIPSNSTLVFDVELTLVK